MGEFPATKKPTLNRSSAPSFRLQNQSLDTIRMRRTFDMFDTNKDDELTISEICQAFANLGLEVDQSELSSTFSDYFKPDRTGLDFEDFLNLHHIIGDELFGGVDDDGAKEEEIEEDLRVAFKVFDENNDGFISALELQKVLVNLGMVEGKEIGTVEDMICSFDRNHDGMVDLSEFKLMMKTTIADINYT